jgi:hypothetical protein
LQKKDLLKRRIMVECTKESEWITMLTITGIKKIADRARTITGGTTHPKGTYRSTASAHVYFTCRANATK